MTIFTLSSPSPQSYARRFVATKKLMYGLLMQVRPKRSWIFVPTNGMSGHFRHAGGTPHLEWSLSYHPHVHLLITGGGITADGQPGSRLEGSFLVPVLVLFRKIAAQFCGIEGRSTDRFRQRTGKRLATELGLLLQALRQR